MKTIRKIVFFVSLCSAASFGGGGGPMAERLVFRGASDASAAVAIGEDMFIVGDDENNVLRVYRTGQAGSPVFSYDLTAFLGIDPEHPEADSLISQIRQDLHGCEGMFNYPGRFC